VAKLINAVERASQMPLSGRMVHEFQRTDLHEMISGNYRVVYLAQEKAIYVVAIFEGHRLFPD
jgi:plasmid stabilization system protein ParE